MEHVPEQLEKSSDQQDIWNMFQSYLLYINHRYISTSYTELFKNMFLMFQQVRQGFVFFLERMEQEPEVRSLLRDEPHSLLIPRWICALPDFGELQ